MVYSKKTNVVLWIAQWALALFFILASGLPKLMSPFLPEGSIPMPLPLPMWFVLLIGTLEVLGGLGLILPGILHLRPELTPLAAVGLMLVAEGATVYNLAAGLGGSALFAVVIGLVAACIAYGRWRLAPLPARSREKVFGAAR
ncbi:MAG: DoxX family protein [Anaerolineae bacterium]